MGRRLYCVKVNRLGRFRIGSFGNFIGLWGIGTVSSCLVSGPGVIRAEEYCLLKCQEQDRTGVCSMGWVLDWLVCIEKAHSQANSLLSVRITWPWEGQSFPNQKAVICQHIKIQKIRAYNTHFSSKIKVYLFSTVK